MENVMRYECLYKYNSKDFNDKNKKANKWEKIGNNFNSSAEESETKFHNIRPVYCHYLKRVKRRNKFVCSKSTCHVLSINFSP